MNGMSRFAGSVLLLSTLVLSCSKPSNGSGEASGDKVLRVVATTTMVSDLVKQIGGDRVQIEGLMGPGVDPHLYKPSASDISKLQRADVIFYNGLLLEGKMQDVFAKMARTKKHVYAVTEGVPVERLLEPPEFAGHYDPHLWFDVPLWATCLDVVARGLSDANPVNRDYFEQRRKQAQEQMAALHAWARTKAAELPKEKRILITSHDAFNYFGRAYEFQVVGLQGISTVEEANLAAMVQMVEFIRKHQIKAVFVESSVPQQAIRRISEDAKVKIGGELFSDAMGTPGQLENGYDLGTYEGMIKHNLNKIVDNLK